MIESPALLRSYVRGIRRLSSAESVSLFVPTLPGGLFQPLLIQDGKAEPVPELLDLETAERYVLSFDDQSNFDPNPTSLQLIPSSEDNCALIILPDVEAPWELARFGVDGPARRRTDVEESAETGFGAWLGLRFAPGKDTVQERLAGRNLPARIHSAEDAKKWWDWLFVLGGALASHTSRVTAILKDPVTGLADRKAFQAVLTDQIERALADEQPLSLLLINPDQFAEVNERLGREAGDRCVREISERLRPALRMTDLVARYGGVVFAILLPHTPESEGHEIAQRVLERLLASAYLDDQIELGFSIGLSTLESAEDSSAKPLEIVRQADRSLNAAKRDGGNRIVSWRDASDIEEGDGQDRLSGIFTGNMSRDYRNMALLHDTIDILALGTDFEGLATEVVHQLYGAFTPDRIGVFTSSDSKEIGLISGLTRRDSSSGLQSRVETVELEPFERQQIEIAFGESRAREIHPLHAGQQAKDLDAGRTAFVAPLKAGKQILGCLFIEGRRSTLTLDAADLIFLESLAAQVAVALDRAKLTARERRRQEQERRRLRTELSELRQALQHVKMVYRSPEMEDLMITVRRVAPTDATVLVTGESGTGKELLARTVHELSLRKEHPFVIVDCGAISSTLIESELFGHERGAYTGAEIRRLGRLQEARHGTVLLDEIGELPLEVQSKLLRFVQDKQFTTVGGSKAQTVDVRIIAATNRDLATEVKAGRFREDLYHRLNVVRLEIPPLRDRPDDILHLARHFLDLFAIQYQKGVRQLTPEAEAILNRNRWSGNVRELQNRILQSVILTEGETIGADELGLTPRTSRRSSRFGTESGTGSQQSPDERNRVAEKLRDDLQQELGLLIDRAISTSPPLRLPIGSWLRDDLMLEAADATGRTARDAAALVGMPESTFRRRLRAATDQEESGLSNRPEEWSQIRRILRDLTRLTPDGDGHLHSETHTILLGEILARLPTDVRTGAQLLGVSPPTFRSRAENLARDG